MKILKRISFLGAAALFLSSCSVTRPLAVTDNSIGTKVGKSKTTCLFSFPTGATGAGVLISNGVCFNKDYGLVDAAKNGQITTVGAIDIKETNFYVFRTFELIVAGE